jgi:uncharacterized protein (DUF1697 family)
MPVSDRSKHYVAFLRAINVGGRFVKMNVLSNIFSLAGFENVRTFIQSGNVIFDSEETDAELLEERIGRLLQKELGFEVNAMIRTMSELEAMVRRNPFKELPSGTKVSVAFMSAALKEKMKTPFFSPKRDVEIIEVRGRNAFCVHHLVEGKWGYPNLLLEKTFRVRTTVRFWQVLSNLVDFAKSSEQ